VSAPAATVTWAQVAAHRLDRQGLTARRPYGADAPAAVATDLCGLHAQLLSSAELSLWARLDGFSPGDLATALWQDRTLVKLWAMRGTLHLLPSAGYARWQAALATYRHFLKPSWSKAFGVSPAELDVLVDAVRAALDGPPLTRTRLADAVARITGSAGLADKLRESWGAVLKPVSFRGALCFADNDGQHVRFTRPDRWLAGVTERDAARGAGGGQGDAAPPGDGDAAVAAIVRRYLAAHGPADREDIGRWWAVSPAAAQRIVRDLGDEVAEVDVEGWRGYALAASLPALTDASVTRSVRLLPAFDPWVIGATRHPQLLVGGAAVRDRVYRRQGWISAVVLIDGMAAGTWSHEAAGGSVTVTVEPFAPLPAWARAGVVAEAEALAAYRSAALDLIWS
jgi:hypothetical protein